MTLDRDNSENDMIPKSKFQDCITFTPFTVNVIVDAEDTRLLNVLEKESEKCYKDKTLIVL